MLLIPIFELIDQMSVFVLQTLNLLIFDRSLLSCLALEILKSFFRVLQAGLYSFVIELLRLKEPLRLFLELIILHLYTGEVFRQLLVEEQILLKSSFVLVKFVP